MSNFTKQISLLLILSGFTFFAQSPCSGGLADGTYPCNGLTMQSYISSATMGSVEAQDSWGWTDVDGNGD